MKANTIAKILLITILVGFVVFAATVFFFYS